MSNLSLKTKKNHSYDAIVIGSGMTGGWAAKELCEKGLSTLVLERGPNVEHVTDYPTALKDTWELPHRGRLPVKFLDENPIVSSCYAFNEATQHFFVKDNEHPYVQVKPFHWIRGYQVGGKSLTWGRWTQRWSDIDFGANLHDGIGIDWPIRYKDIEPWYSYVEKFVGISGNRDGLPQIPDGEFQPPMEMNCLEKHLKKSIEEQYPGRNLVISRTANLTQPIGNRGSCQYRDLCARGCPFGAYFSSNSATLPAARSTGNMTLLADSVVHSILFDPGTQKATGVRVIHTNSKEVSEYYGDLVFLNAGTINSAMILLNSTSSRFPNGLGNDSGVLGHFLMDHNYRASFGGAYEGFKDRYYYGRRPTGVYLPRFRNIGTDRQDDFIRGYAYAAGGFRTLGNLTNESFGIDFKDAISRPGEWNLWMTGMGECLPYFDNKVTLSSDKTDEWGMPQVEIDFEFRENELRMLDDIVSSGQEMLEHAGFKNIYAYDTDDPPGLGIHEMGTVRMGRDPNTSALNGFNQMWDVKNLFVTDGACMTSSACQNPSLTYMALTARAVDYAVTEFNKGNI